jgi:hypothetical protein
MKLFWLGLIQIHIYKHEYDVSVEDNTSYTK